MFQSFYSRMEKVFHLQKPKMMLLAMSIPGQRSRRMGLIYVKVKFGKETVSLSGKDKYFKDM